jgi:hypothetical protein
MMIHLLQNSQVPTSINVIEHKWKPLHLQFNITFVIFFHSYLCMIFEMLFVGHDVA